jgi:signal transduction histidine kinase
LLYRTSASLLLHFLSVVVLGIAFALSQVVSARAEDQTPRILIIVESDSRLPFVQVLLRGIEAELGPDFTTRAEIYVEYLDMLRFNSPAELERSRSFLTARYRDIGLSAVGVLGVNALAFVAESRNAFAPGVPIIFGGFSDDVLARMLSQRHAAQDLSGIASLHDALPTLDLALQLQPDAPEIVVVAGSGDFDRRLWASVEGVVSGGYAGKPVRLLAEASAESYLAEARTLDPRSIVLLLTVNLDAEGRRFLPVQFATALAESSAAPVWSLYETQIGTGVVGGVVEDVTATGREIGAMLRTAAARAPLPQPVRATAVPILDWRALQRHGLDMALLPENAVVRFHEPTLWERYRVWFIAVSATVLAQTATILGLVFQRRRYNQAQALLDVERNQLIHVSRNLLLGQLSASLAHEINQPLAAIQANAEAGTRLAGRNPPDQEEIGAIFRDINDDVRRAGSTIASLRRLMIKGEVMMEPLDLNGIVKGTLSLVANELAVNGTKIHQTLAPGPMMVNGNGPQLQQVVLNLVLNASDAMAGLPEAERIVKVSTSALPDRGVSLTVEDGGPGIPVAKREAVFQPFFSEKSTGLGIGLSICRSIALAHAGTLAFADPLARGAKAVLNLPGTGGPA